MEGKSKLQRWAYFLGGLAAIWFVSQVLAPMGNAFIPGIDKLMEVTDILDIDPGEFWYMDVETSGEAIMFTSNSTNPDLTGRNYNGN